MINKTDCAICKKAIKQKYKNYTFWKALAIVFIIISFVFMSLFVFSGKLFTKEEITNQEIVVKNDGGIENSEIGTITTTTIDYIIPISIFMCSIIVSGGIIIGCYIISQKNNNKSKDNN